MTHDYKIPMSLSVLWPRWQELEKLEDHDKKVLAEFDAIEDRIVGDEVENTADLLVKLRHLPHLSRDFEWSEKTDRLYQSIIDGYQKLVVKNRDPWTDLENMQPLVARAVESPLTLAFEDDEEAS
jgi:hypothetical protein